MSPPEHMVIGLAAANLTYGLVNLGVKKQTRYLRFALISSIAAVLPDIDSFFGNYGSLDPKIGHRGMTHSFAGIICLGIGLSFLFSAVISGYNFLKGYYLWLVNWIERRNRFKREFDFSRFFLQPFHWKFLGALFLFSFTGGLTHILADLPTPKGNWQGLPLFFPLSLSRYGDLNLIGWYDIWGFWIVTAGIAASAPLVILSRVFNKEKFKTLAISIFFCLVLVNVYTFVSLTGHIKNSSYENERQWYIFQMNIVIKKLPGKAQTFTRKAINAFVIIYKQARNQER